MFVRKPKSQYDFATKKDVWMLRRGKPLQSPKKTISSLCLPEMEGVTSLQSLWHWLIDSQHSISCQWLSRDKSHFWEVFWRNTWFTCMAETLHATSGFKRGSTEAGETLDRFQLYLNPPFTAVGLSLALEVAWMHSQAVILATNRQVSGPGRTFRAGNYCSCDLQGCHFLGQN